MAPRALRWRVPKVGLAVGTGLFVVDSIASLQPSLLKFGGSGLGYDLAIAWLLYAGPCAVLDALLLAARPEAGRAFGLLRLGLGLGLFGAANLLVGRGGLVAFLPLGGLWALLALYRWTTPLAALALAWALLPALPRHTQGPGPRAPASAPAGGPSIAVIVLDTLRWDHTSAYGHERETTPHLTALAARGARFERAYTTSCWSLPSHASIFTGLLPEQHGAHAERAAIHGSIPTLAELLRARGYQTAAFTANPWITRSNGLGRGFDHFEEFWQRFLARATFLSWQATSRLLSPSRDKGGAAIVFAVGRWLGERDPERPYFLFVNLMEAHAPYQEVPSEFRFEYVPSGVSRFRTEVSGARCSEAQRTGLLLSESETRLNLDLMDGAAAAADQYLGDIVERVGEDVIVFVVSDHGDMLGEHDLYGHAVSLYEPLIRIPMVVAGPGVPPGVVVEDVASLIDVAPTVLALSGASRPDLPGEDLVSLARGERRPERAAWAQQFHIRDLRRRGWHRHRGEEEAEALGQRRAAVVTSGLKRMVAADGSDLLYDLARDPGELRPTAGADSSLPVNVPGAEEANGSLPELPVSSKAALRALGYVE